MKNALLNKQIEKKNWYPEYMRSTEDRTFILSHFLRDYLFQHRLRYMIFFRNAQTAKFKIIKLYYEVRLFRLCRKYGIELKTKTKVGEGFLMIHPYNITVTPQAIIGRNVTMLKGSTIGLTWGENGGAPVIGDLVYVGLNSTVLGKVKIGDDVLIAPDTFVNIDVPSHSLVIGNPCKIIPRENATQNCTFKVV